MRRRRTKEYFNCPVEAALDLIDRKWKPVLLFRILAQKRRFGELRRLLPGLAPRMLTLQLRELEADGLIHREVFAEVPPRVEYSITPFGASLKPALFALANWSLQNMPERIDPVIVAELTGAGGHQPSEMAE